MIILEDMTREQLITLVKDQQWAIDHQRAQLKVLAAYSAGGLEKVTELLRQAETERDQLRARLVEESPIEGVQALSRPLVMPAADLEAGIEAGLIVVHGKKVCTVAVTVAALAPDGELTEWRDLGYFPGTMADVREIIRPEIHCLVSGCPTAADISGDLLPGLTVERFLAVLRDLTPCRRDKRGFEKRRKQAFDELWPDLAAPDYPYDRREAGDRFKKSIDRTFEGAKSRRQRIKNSQ